jgi:glutamyl-Q tRNA(Asp) synthetase
VPAQSTRLASYGAAADALRARGLLYPCTCTRKDIEDAGARPGLEGLIYPGTCKHTPPDPARPAAWRLDAARALDEVGPLIWEDDLAGPQAVDLSGLGDVVLVRKDLPASYHLAVTLDDAADGVTLVTRGADLFAASHVHRTLQALLGLSVPRWHHHSLLTDETGQKLAKRRGSPALAEQREAGEDGRMLAQQLRLQQVPLGT